MANVSYTKSNPYLVTYVYTDRPNVCDQLSFMSVDKLSLIDLGKWSQLKTFFIEESEKMRNLRINPAHVITMIDIIAKKHFDKETPRTFFQSSWNDIESDIDTCLTKHEDLRESEQAFKMIFKCIHDILPAVMQKLREIALSRIQDRMNRVFKSHQ
jgi:hypothetical protein